MKITVDGIVRTLKEYPAVNMEERLKRIEDIREIEELMHYYCMCADNKDAVGQASCFCKEGAMQLAESYEPVIGREDIAQWIEKFLDMVVTGSHYISNFQLYFDGPGTAVAYMYGYSWQSFTEYPKKSDCHRWARYEIKYEKEDGYWRIKKLLMLSSGEYNGHRACEQFGRPWPPGASQQS